VCECVCVCVCACLESGVCGGTVRDVFLEGELRNCNLAVESWVRCGEEKQVEAGRLASWEPSMLWKR